MSANRRTRRRAGALKFLASAGFVGLAIGSGALESVYGRLLLTGLLLSLLGDVLLVPVGRGRYFLMGTGSFLLAHIAYTLAFFRWGIDFSNLLWAIGPVAALVLLVWRHLGSHLRDHYRLVVPVYMLVIVVMLLVASATGEPLLLVGAWLFAWSVVLVARQRFVRQSFFNLLLGLPLYYCAQYLLAASPLLLD